MKSQPITISVTLLLALFLCGCEVVFTHAPAGKLTKDKALVGNWINEEKGKEATTLQLDKGSGGEIKVSFLPANPDEPNPVLTAKILIIANHSYMVLNPTNEDRHKGFLIALYEITCTDLIIYIPTEETFNH